MNLSRSAIKTPDVSKLPPELLETLADLHEKGANIRIEVDLPQQEQRGSWLKDRIEDRANIKALT